MLKLIKTKEIKCSNDLWNLDYIRIITIDPADKNFALLIESRYENEIKTEILVKFNVQENTKTDNFLYHEVSQKLDEYSDFYETCHIFLIEDQLSHKNPFTPRMQSLVIMYFIYKFEKLKINPLMYTLNSRLKGILLQNMKFKTLKVRCFHRAIEILETRKDYKTIEILKGLKNYKDKNKKKLDDAGDVILMAEIFCILVGYIPRTKFTYYDNFGDKIKIWYPIPKIRKNK